jgi:hypothetical protein
MEELDLRDAVLVGFSMGVAKPSVILTGMEAKE